MSVERHRAAGPRGLGFALLTVSDTRVPEDDVSGATARRLVEGAGHRVVATALAPDEVPAIRAAAGELLARPEADVLVLTGGTGFAPRDVTVEAVTPLLDRPMEGFGELFRLLSYQEIGAAAMLSRATAGIAAGKPLFALPGSPKAVALALEKLILPEAPHLLGLLRRP